MASQASSLNDSYLSYYNLDKKEFAIALSEWFWRKTREVLNLRNPKTFNEKIQWLKLYDSSPFKTMTTDKYLVRDWVKKKIGEEYLIPLLGVYDRFEDIGFGKLPKSFVIKTNHGSGWNWAVKDKQKMDIPKVRAKFDTWVEMNYAFKFGFELHYKDISPKIIIEKYVQNRSGNLYDWKIWCFNGNPTYIQFRDDWRANLKMCFFDTEWKKQPFCYEHPLYKAQLDKPNNLEEMLHIAKILSKNLIFVCVDLYRLDDGKIYFGEMTHTRSSGVARWCLMEYNLKLGELIKLPSNMREIMSRYNYITPKCSQNKR